MRAQTVNFERGQDPKEALGIGVNQIIPEITSNDLEILDDIIGDKDILTYDEWYEDHGEDYEDDEEALEMYRRLVKIDMAIGDKIKWGEFFDHHEEDELESYLDNTPPGMQYAYNGYPDGDGWQVIWSSIFLPAAEELRD